jgi:serine/threonine protein kinase
MSTSQNESTGDRSRHGPPDSSAPPDPDDRAIMSFLKDLEGASNADEVVRRHAALHPHLAREFRELVAMVEKIVPPPAESAEPPRPERLGDFRIVGEIGYGGMGMVYEALQDPFHRRVAVKTIRSRLGRISGTTRARFLREQTALAKLHHNHIVPIHAAGHAEALDYYAMRYIEGASLSDVVNSVRHFESSHRPGKTPTMAQLAESAEQKRERQMATPTRSGNPLDQSGDRSATLTAPDRSPAGPASVSPLPNRPLRLSMEYLRSVARVTADAADALQHAHEAGILHRDVKPSNIMVDRQEHCWVVDFGLAALQPGADGAALGRGGAPGREADPEPAPLLTSGLLGTPAYMAPEQFESRTDRRTDVWGLGVTLYELLTLRRAFTSKAEVPSTDPPAPRSLMATIPRTWRRSA